jgi:hypothetical protein
MFSTTTSFLPCVKRTVTPFNESFKLQFARAEKGAIIADIVVGALVAVVATLAILASRGVNLGHLSVVGSMGTKVAYALIGGLVVTTIIAFCVQMVHYIRHLSKHDTEAAQKVRDAGAPPPTVEEVAALQTELADVRTVQGREHEELGNARTEITRKENEATLLTNTVTELRNQLGERDIRLNNLANLGREHQSAMQEISNLRNQINEFAKTHLPRADHTREIDALTNQIVILEKQLRDAGQQPILI